MADHAREETPQPETVLFYSRSNNAAGPEQQTTHTPGFSTRGANPWQ